MFKVERTACQTSHQTAFKEAVTMAGEIYSSNYQSGEPVNTCALACSLNLLQSQVCRKTVGRRGGNHVIAPVFRGQAGKEVRED